MKTQSKILWLICWACMGGVVVPGIAGAAELEVEGNRLVVTGMLDGSAVQSLNEHLATGLVQTVVFENSFGGTAEAASDYAQAIRASGVNTEVRGHCHAACAYAFLAGKEHRFGRGLQVNVLLIPVATRPTAEDMVSRWRGEESIRTLAEFMMPSNGTATTTAAATSTNATNTGTPAVPTERWQPNHGVLFMSSPTLFGRIYNTLYCDGTQGRDTSRCETLSNADPYKLGVLTQ